MERYILNQKHWDEPVIIIAKTLHYAKVQATKRCRDSDQNFTLTTPYGDVWIRRRYRCNDGVIRHENWVRA